ncbi:MAG: type II secretion system F family protein [Chloroflexota bacterium]|nr:type II secretion system F family protein [Chloroflexota bacterium]
MNFNLMEIDPVFILLGVILAALGLSLAIYGLLRLIKGGDKVSDRLETFVAPDRAVEGGAEGRPIIAPEMRGSLFSRTVGTWFEKILGFLGRFTPKSMVLDIEHKLTVAGNPGNLSAGSFFALRLLLLLGGLIMAYLLIKDMEGINLTSMLLPVLIIPMSWFLPVAWLNNRMRARQDEIQRGLPDALDMLSVCASAGLGFDQSMQKISEYWDTELGYEFKRTTEEMEMGVSRAVALRHMADRVDVEELTQFVSILIQAERIGMSYADVLHSQATQMRVLRQLRSREIANKLPAKMMLPLVVFIFPAMLIVILGPAIPTILSAF